MEKVYVPWCLQPRTSTYKLLLYCAPDDILISRGDFSRWKSPQQQRDAVVVALTLFRAYLLWVFVIVVTCMRIQYPGSAWRAGGR